MIMYPSPFITSFTLFLTFTIFFLLTITFLSILLNHNRAARRLAFLRPIFIQQLRESTGQTAATIKATNLTGDLMDMDIPMHRIEQVRRNAVQAGHREPLLLLSLLVCAAYEDIKSFKDELVDLMEKDITGLQRDGGKLSDMCRYSLTPYTLFKTALCLGSELPDEMTRSFYDQNVSRDLNAVFRFRTVRASLRLLVLPVTAFLISGAVHLYVMALPPVVSWSLLLMALMLTGLMLLMFTRTLRSLGCPISCVDIEADIKLDIPDFKPH